MEWYILSVYLFKGSCISLGCKILIYLFKMRNFGAVSLTVLALLVGTSV